ncbi:MAG: glycine betaine ABC transporter substrate-binding protein, partial [Micromonosporaceae bacterium]
MHTPARRHIFRALALCSSLALAGALAACGEAGSSGTAEPDAQATGKGCAPVEGEKLVVLPDDEKLQNVENVVPAVNADKSSPELTAALNQVSESLDTDKLIALNKAVDVERESPQKAAAAYAKQAGIGKGLKQGSGSVVIGAADFSESKTLGALYAYALNAAGFDASVRTIGNRELYEPALEKGDIHVVPEYAGTLAEFLNQKVNGKDAKPAASSDLDTTMEALIKLGKERGLTFGRPSAAADQNAFAVTEAFADKHG